MRRFGQARVVAMHHLALVNLDTLDRRAQAEPLLRIEREISEFLDFFDTDQMFSAANAGAQLDNNIRATAERARFFAVRLQNTDRLIERAWSFVVNRVQG